MARMISEPTAKGVETLNMLASISNPFGTIPFLLSYMLMKYIPVIHTTNTIDILSKKGISKTPPDVATAHPKLYKGSRSKAWQMKI